MIEKQSLMAMTAERLKKLSEKLRVPLIFKSSYLKDNRSDELSYQGPGLEEGLEMLAWIRKEFELPVLSDVHSVEEIAGRARGARRDPDPRVPVSADDAA